MMGTFKGDFAVSILIFVAVCALMALLLPQLSAERVAASDNTASVSCVCEEVPNESSE